LAAQALLRVRTADYVAGDTSYKLDTLVDLTQGQFQLDFIPPGDYTLEVRSAAQAAIYPLNIKKGADSMDIGTIYLAPTVQIKGKLPPDFDPNAQIFVPGLEIMVKPDANGHFVIDSLPPGKHQIQFNGSDSIYKTPVTAKPADTLDISISERQATRLLLDDFEGRGDRHKYAFLTEGGHWYLKKSPGVSLDNANQKFPIASHASCGRCMQITANMDESKPLNWFEFGLHLGGPYETYDFSGVDSIAFKVRGRGEVAFKLLAQDALSMEFFKVLKLDSSWERQVIAVADMEFISYDLALERTTAATALKRISSLAFFSINNTEIWLDDVELLGKQVFIFP
jgi:hypothetical protein